MQFCKSSMYFEGSIDKPIKRYDTAEKKKKKKKENTGNVLQKQSSFQHTKIFINLIKFMRSRKISQNYLVLIKVKDRILFRKNHSDKGRKLRLI